MTARARDPQDASGPTGGDVERVVRALRALTDDMGALLAIFGRGTLALNSLATTERLRKWSDGVQALAALRVAPAASPVAWQEALFTYRARVYQYAPLEAAAELDAKYEAVLDAALTATPR